eukprot:TRINITY_DN2114_c0_g1_i1.p1 TRINITY_DN2114_c0_g1~~TRINITY_DN2114_c0_g1_i1.p1  ORF type:complete len:112 (+),score=20.36 TRINITY_DN2114_c0_g1_i1:13-348(+)
MLSMKQWYQRRVRGACEVNTLGYVMEALPQDLQENIQTFETKLQELENLLQPFFEVEMNERLSSMAPHDAARMNITIAYALNSLFYSTSFSFLATRMNLFSVSENPRYFSC